jgi:hypothetical protein
MGKLKLQHKAKQMTRRFIERMFYFTPTFSSSVKVIYLKVSWQSVFFHHPGVGFKNHASHLDHGIRAN